MAKYRLKEICDFNKSSVKDINPKTIIKYLDTSNLVKGDIIELQELKLQDAPSRARRLVRGATILYSLVRPNLCHYGFISNPIKNLVASTGYITINLKRDFENTIDLRYVFLLLTQNKLTDYLHTIAENAVSAYPSLLPSDIENLIFEFPLLKEQIAITNLYFNISKKIAINREINRNLEALARLLYDYWFVQFEFPDENGRPYKSSGGKMVWNEKLKREIPEGWIICKLRDFIEKENTGDWGYDEFSGDRISIKCIRGADIGKLNNLPNRYIKKTNINKLLKPYDIVIEVSGGSPIQATGRCAYITPGVLERNGYKVTCSNFCQAFSLKQIESSAFFYFLWKQFYENNIMFNYEGKTSGIKNFMTETFLSNNWFYPSKDLQISFFRKLAKMFELKDSNILEINLLTLQRDELLPLLMNGQISVKPKEENCDLYHD